MQGNQHPVHERIVALCETWHRRADKWHKRLVAERRWLSRGVSAPVFFGALASLAAGLLLLVPALQPYSKWAALCAPVMTVVSAIVGWRANAARTELEAGKVEQVWVSADRIATHYDALVVRLRCKESPDAVLRESDRIEACARFGLPEELRKALLEPRQEEHR